MTQANTAPATSPAGGSAPKPPSGSGAPASPAPAKPGGKPLPNGQPAKASNTPTSKPTFPILALIVPFVVAAGVAIAARWGTVGLVIYLIVIVIIVIWIMVARARANAQPDAEAKATKKAVQKGGAVPQRREAVWQRTMLRRAPAAAGGGRNGSPMGRSSRVGGAGGSRGSSTGWPTGRRSSRRGGSAQPSGRGRGTSGGRGTGTGRRPAAGTSRRPSSSSTRSPGSSRRPTGSGGRGGFRNPFRRNGSSGRSTGSGRTGGRSGGSGQSGRGGRSGGANGNGSGGRRRWFRGRNGGSTQTPGTRGTPQSRTGGGGSSSGGAPRRARWWHRNGPAGSGTGSTGSGPHSASPRGNSNPSGGTTSGSGSRRRRNGTARPVTGGRGAAIPRNPLRPSYHHFPNALRRQRARRVKWSTSRNPLVRGVRRWNNHRNRVLSLPTKRQRSWRYRARRAIGRVFGRPDPQIVAPLGPNGATGNGTGSTVSPPPAPAAPQPSAPPAPAPAGGGSLNPRQPVVQAVPNVQPAGVVSMPNDSSSNVRNVQMEPAPPWLRTTVEALEAASRQFDPENARAVVAVMDHFPTLVEAMGTFATKVGNRSVDAVDLPPSAQEMFLSLGAGLLRSVGPVRDGLQAAKRTVLDRIARYQGQRAKDARWDVSKNVPK